MKLNYLLNKLHLKKKNNNNNHNVSLRHSNSYSENLNQLNSRHSIRKSKSFNDFKHNIVNSIKRSTSIRKNPSLKKSSSSSTLNLNLDLHSHSFHKTNKNKQSLRTLHEKQNETDIEINLLQSNLSDSLNNFNNSTDETYTTLFNSLFNNYIDNDSDSIQSSYISSYNSNLINYKKKIFLLNSKLPNYDFSCSNSPFENPFSEFENYNDLPHEKLLLRVSQIHGLSPTDSLSDAIKKQRKSLYLDNIDSNNNDNNDLFCVFNDENNILPLPLIHNKPFGSLPPLPSTNSSYPVNLYEILNENKSNNELNFSDVNTNDFDLEEKSLFDALSNVEWWDCSKITLSTYNN